jgi:tRNA (cmo5U34)-methyltransferase
MDKPVTNGSEWQTVDHALAYLSRANKLPHRTEGERVLLNQIPPTATRILDLGTGDGRTLALAMLNKPNAQGIGLDFSELMLKQAKKRFLKDPRVQLMVHDLAVPLPREKVGCFDAVVSSLAIHHLTHERKRQLYEEVFGLLNAEGVFCNFEHVSPASERIHLRFQKEINQSADDPSNKLLDVETQLRWLREIGFVDVDCYWKWMEVALLVGVKP